MACDYDTEYKCGDSLYDLTKKILGRLKQLVGFGPGGGGGGGDVTLTVSDVEIGAIEIKDSTTDNRATVRNTDPDPSDFGLVVRNIPSGTQVVSGPFLTDAQLRASAVPISAASLPLPTGAATQATLASILTEVDDLNTKFDIDLSDVQLELIAIKLSTANLDVALSTRASEASLLVAISRIEDVILNTSGLISDLSGVSSNLQDIRNLAFAATGAEAPTAATVGVASAEAVPANAARTALYLTNTSNNVISIAFGATAVLNSGITLFPGDSFAMLRPGLNLSDAVNAIAGAASSNLAIQEFSV